MASFADLKKLVRSTVHKIMGVPAFYHHGKMVVPTVSNITARWHSKIDRMGDLDNGNYAEVIEGVDRIIFNDVDARAINLREGGRIWFPDLAAGGVVPKFILRVREPADGPCEEVWLVALDVD